ncbi:MAG TPA: deoxyguanosinetriphosphate triphosphohydrolase, partial [Calditrichia bacterium]|nr:deoxyguanosinetriphosphate triphosphohydrolase [Calditrichia bacterium]
QLFEALRDNYLGEDQPIKLLSDIHHQRVVNAASETEKMRELCDYVAGMTDRFVLRAYRRLFDPGFGSILDFV